MKHIGETLLNHIESKHLKKKEVADAAGITTNYLSTIFHKETIDADLLERLCRATGMSPMAVFEYPYSIHKEYSDITASTVVGAATVTIGQEKSLRELLAEKERTIKILMHALGISENGTEPSQKS